MKTNTENSENRKRLIGC